MHISFTELRRAGSLLRCNCWFILVTCARLGSKIFACSPWNQWVLLNRKYSAGFKIWMFTVHQLHQCFKQQHLSEKSLFREFRTSTAFPFLIPPSQTTGDSSLPRLLQTLSGNYILFTEEGSSVSLRDHNRSMWWQLFTQTPQLPKQCSWAAGQHRQPRTRAVRMLCLQGSYRNPRLAK